ncbi:MAG: TlpA family protein disulfide reductase [Prevotellaceae bacterium]|jgi:thiol-disulfide isomerase/thioredoxin|nr:TlpA family protein disulfide reductase [Prevotellaceae bacterium]
MKRIALLVLTLSILGASCTSKKSGINGTFIGLTNDTLWIMVNVLNDEFRFERKAMDTIVVRNGEFFYDPQTNNLTELKIYPLENIERYPNSPVMAFGGPGESLSLLYSPGDRIQMDAVIKEKIVAFQASGNRYNEQLSTLHANAQNAFKQRSEALKIIRDNSYDGDKTVYREQLQEAVQIVNNNELNYIRENPDEPLSAYFVASFREEAKVFQYMDSLGNRAKESIMGQLLEGRIKGIHASNVLREENARKEKAQKEIIGQSAPDFTLKDADGNDFSLSSLRGKYVVLDFWGSWCGWCLDAIPRIKEYYAAHPNEFEIVGIAFSDKPDNWCAAVEKHALSWINLIDTENDSVSKSYYVVAAPTYVLIDKGGTIVGFPSYDSDAMEKIDELRRLKLL